MLRDCGECKLCCKLFGVGTIAKAPMQWCSHCNIYGKYGCKVYDTRPDECKAFLCA